MNNLYEPYQYNRKTLILEKYLILGEIPCSSDEYSLFDRYVNPFAKGKIEEIRQSGYDGFELFDELNRERFNTFKYYPDGANKKIFLYSEVYCKTKTKVIVNVTCSHSGKLWVNDTCLSIHCNTWANTNLLTVRLQKGINTFLLEQFSPGENHIFSIQLLNYNFEMGGDPKALSNCRSYAQINPLILVNENFYQPNQSKFRFMYMANDKMGYQPNYRVEIHDSNKGFIKTLTARINEVTELNLDELRQLHPETLRHEWVGCTFKDTDKKELPVGFCLFLNDFTEKKTQIKQELLGYAKELDDEITAAIQGRISRQDSCLKNGDIVTDYWLTWQEKDLLEQLRTGQYPYQFYKNGGVHEFYLYSKLDDSYIRISARIPNNFDTSKAYPVILALSTGNDGGFSWVIPEDRLEEPVLCFDVTGRGFTGGSYVGEASTFEVLTWIMKNYLIDQDRIYILGQSNGGFATWATAQNHPNLAAAIYPQIGYIHIQGVENTSNIPTYQVVSPKDHVFRGRVNEIKDILKKYGNYYQYDFTEMTHNQLTFQIANSHILNCMLQARKDKFPSTINYCTERNRHLEAFWLRLHGIAEGKKFTKIKATIENDNLIRIRVQNSTGFTLTVPPQVNKKAFAVSVNSKCFTFENTDEQKIIFEKRRTWETTQNEPIVDYRKGTGLLDVYLNSMRIIVPTCTDETLKTVAANFAKPNSNGFDPVICVNYPIYMDDCVPDQVFSHNLILININGSNRHVRRFADALKVKCDGKGYNYRDNYTEGDYVVMQVIANPYNPKLSILVVSTNQENLLKKHILLRKVVIPTYCNGIHTYWNNQILVFQGGKYYSAYENGSKLEEITNKKMRTDTFGREF